jgi:tetratricopeptide (TPR) repeat protein
MLEVIAEYASERLLSSESSADSHALRQRHAEFFANFAAEAPAGLRGPDQVRWLERLESEHDNFRAALEWTIANDEAELAGRLAAGVWPFWRARGYFHEGRRRLASVLALRDAMPLASLAAILNGSGVLAILQSDYAAATSFLEQALDLFRALENQRGVAFALSNLGWVAHDCADVDRAAALFEESLRIRRGLHDTWGQASSILNLGMIAISRNDPAEAARLFDESARLFRGIGDSVSLAQALTNAGWALHLVGDYTRATQLFSESLALAQRLQDARRIADNLSNLGLMALYRGDYASARDLYADSFTVFVELDDKRGMAESLEGRAAVAAVQGHAREAARQFGLAAAFRESVGALLLPGDRARYDSAIAVAREQLEDREWNQAWQEGAQGAMEEEIARLRVS